LTRPSTPRRFNDNQILARPAAFSSQVHPRPG
jgi:hypothetical protein